MWTWLWILGGNDAVHGRGAGWDTWCLGRGCAELEALGIGEGVERLESEVWGCQWEVCAGEKTLHMLLTANPPECGCGFQGAAADREGGGPWRVLSEVQASRGRHEAEAM